MREVNPLANSEDLADGESGYSYPVGTIYLFYCTVWLGLHLYAFEWKSFATACISHKYLAKIRNRIFECRYVEGVANLIDCRNVGITRFFLLRDIEKANRKGVYINMLDSFKHDFYVKLEFSLVARASNTLSTILSCPVIWKRTTSSLFPGGFLRKVR